MSRVDRFKFIIPEHVKNILKLLNENGFQSYIVGGSIRDFLIGKIPTDFDIITDAVPDFISSIFECKKIGEKFGSLVIYSDEQRTEITTFRVEKNYFDRRHPNEVCFTSNLNEDLVRRDFTINAICYSLNEKIIDNYFGLEDLNKKIIRTVGSPFVKFREDYLRIFRAIRFCAELGFNLESETKEAIILNSLISSFNISILQLEFKKTLIANLFYIYLYFETGIIRYIFPHTFNLFNVNLISLTEFYKKECVECSQKELYSSFANFIIILFNILKTTNECFCYQELLMKIINSLSIDFNFGRKNKNKLTKIVFEKMKLM